MMSLTVAAVILASCDGSTAPRIPNSLEIQASSDTITFHSLTSSDSVLLTAVVRDEAGREYPADEVQWFSSSDRIGFVRVDSRTAKASWLGSPSSTHSVTITASIWRNGGNVLGTRDVIACGVSSVAPYISGTMLLGRSVDLVARTQSGATATNPPPTWTSSNPTVVSTDGSRATANQVGSATLRATVCGHSRSADVVVIPKGYTVTAVNIPGATDFRLNSEGQVVSLSSSAHTRTVWDHGTTTVTDLGACAPVDVNDSGQVLCAGNGPVIWENGSATQRDTVTFAPSHGQSSPVGITKSGAVVGMFMVWRGPGDVVRAKCASFDCWSQGAFNNRLDVLIHGDFLPCGCRASWIWDSRVNFPYGLGADPIALNDSGDAVATGTGLLREGSFWLAAESWRTKRPLPFLPTAINNKGVITGSSASMYDIRADRLSLLNQLLADPNWSLTTLLDINDNGQILAKALDKTTNVTATVLVDPPPP